MAQSLAAGQLISISPTYAPTLSLTSSLQVYTMSRIQCTRGRGYRLLPVRAQQRQEGALVSLGPVAAAGEADSFAPSLSCPLRLASAPHTSSWGLGIRPELRVLSLPGLALVHTHRLEGMKVRCLAADPCGTALAVCDYASESTHVLAWPLPGMPDLEW